MCETTNISNKNLKTGIDLIKDKRNGIKILTSKILQWKPFDVGFNAFVLMSDIYYRENFHSDILAEILNPNGKHEEGNKFLKLFFQFIDNIKVINNSKLVELLTDDDIDVYREKGRIDILIHSEKNKWAIIIENKINGAPDRDRQIQSYIEFCEKRKLEVKAIIYIPRNNYKKGPNFPGYTKNEKEKIEDKLICIPGYNNKNKNNDILFWLEQCELVSNTVNARNVFQQYKNIVKKQGIDSICHEEIEKFVKLCDGYDLSNIYYLVKDKVPRFISDSVKYTCNMEGDNEILFRKSKKGDKIKNIVVDVNLKIHDWFVKMNDNKINTQIDIFVRNAKIDKTIYNLTNLNNENVNINKEKMVIKIGKEEFVFFKKDRNENEQRFCCDSINLDVYDIQSFIKKVKDILNIIGYNNQKQIGENDKKTEKFLKSCKENEIEMLGLYKLLNGIPNYVFNCIRENLKMDESKNVLFKEVSCNHEQIVVDVNLKIKDWWKNIKDNKISPEIDIFVRNRKIDEAVDIFKEYINERCLDKVNINKEKMVIKIGEKEFVFFKKDRNENEQRFCCDSINLNVCDKQSFINKIVDILNIMHNNVN